ncbi:MAG: M42 family peptidase [Clostridia bacterium]|nr:M42 family peptidase [Clostridia bacterium]
MLKTLACANGISGFEESVAEIVINNIKPFCTTLEKDSIGNIYAFKKGKNPKKTVALFAHTDEVGLMVSSITEEGFLKFRTVGGIDNGVLPGKTVIIGKNRIKGVIGSRAVHLIDESERKEKIPFDKMYIDIGAESKAEAESQVKKGDPVYFEADFVETESCIFGKAFDDRIGCAILSELIKEDFDDDIYFVFTTQEEVGTRGATVASRYVDADFYLVIENTTCLDMPKVPQEKRSTNLGSGPALTIVDSGTVADLGIRGALSDAGVKIQYKNVAAGGNDGFAISKNGKKVAAVSVPCRYLHTPIGVISKSDLKDTICLIRAFLKGENR